MFARKQKPTSSAPPAIPSGRERLVFTHSELAKAKQCVTELDEQRTRLESAIAIGKAADGRIKVALLAGSELDDVTAMTALKAKAAGEALPEIKAQLAAAQAEVSRLANIVGEEALAYLRIEAGDVVSRYRAAWRALCAEYDELCGIAAALGMRAAAEIGPLEAPNINLTSYEGVSGRMMHQRSDDAHVSPTAKKWTEAVAKLVANPNAEVLDEL